VDENDRLTVDDELDDDDDGGCGPPLRMASSESDDRHFFDDDDDEEDDEELSSADSPSVGAYDDEQATHDVGRPPRHVLTRSARLPSNNAVSSGHGCALNPTVYVPQKSSSKSSCAPVTFLHTGDDGGHAPIECKLDAPWPPSEYQPKLCWSSSGSEIE